jgi:hypothetical protein
VSGLIVAHGSGIDEIAFVALPVLVFVVLRWLNRRRARSAGRGAEEPPISSDHLATLTDNELRVS